MEKVVEKYTKIIGERFGDLFAKELIIKENSRRVLMLFECICGNEIIRKPAIALSGKLKSCGCRQSRKRTELVNELIGKTINYLTILELDEEIVNSKLRTKYKCQCRCGQIKSIDRNSIIRNVTLSCGCYKIEYLKSRTGEKSHRYKSSITNEDRILRDERKRVNVEYNNWRNKVRKIYGYKCFLCENPYKLIIHHLDSYANFKEKRYDVNNGVCLCKQCHNIFHYLFGQFNNTKEQFDKFYGIFLSFGLNYLIFLYENKLNFDKFWFDYYNLPVIESRKNNKDFKYNVLFVFKHLKEFEYFKWCPELEINQSTEQNSSPIQKEEPLIVEPNKSIDKYLKNYCLGNNFSHESKIFNCNY